MLGYFVLRHSTRGPCRIADGHLAYPVHVVDDDHLAEAGEVTYAITGKAKAYVLYQQGVPAGFERLNLWPVDAFDAVQPPTAP